MSTHAFDSGIATVSTTALPSAHDHSTASQPQTRPRVLVVEDDPDIGRLIEMHLSNLYDTRLVENGLLAFELACSESWDLLVLDLQLPGKDGLEICRDLRGQGNPVPVLMVTSRSTEIDRVLGLEMGADDYLVKPFSVIELVARIKAILRRVSMDSRVPDEAVSPDELTSKRHELVVNTRLHRVTRGGASVELTGKEFDLLSYFVENPESVFSRAHLLYRVWGQGQEGYEHTVNSHINRLRAKIEDDPTQPRIIVTVWGVGYRLG